MANVFLIHWHEAEARERASTLRDAGHVVVVHWSTESSPAWQDSLPDLAVISLDRLPSHGRAVAEWLWEAKKRQHIPILFTGGEPAKIAVTRAKFPKALYCATASIVTEIARLVSPRSSIRTATAQATSAAQANGGRRADKTPQRPTRSRTPARKKPRSRG